MIVLHVIDSGGFFGAEAILLNLMREQRDMGITPVLCSIGTPASGPKEIESRVREYGLNVEVIRMLPGLNIIGAMRILKQAMAYKVNIIHSHGYKGDILLGIIPKYLRKLPLISTLHGWTNVRSMSKLAIYEWVQLRILKYLDAVVVVNKNMLNNYKFLSANIPPGKIYVVNNGIKVEKAPVLQQDETFDETIPTFAKNSFVVGAIGRLSHEKGYEYLLKGLKLLAQEGHEVKLILIGDGPLMNELTQHTHSLGISGLVLLPGYRDNARIYLKYFDVFIISSFTEGLPITLLEAMNAKVPIIATNVGGIPDVIVNGESGLLVPPGDPQAITNAVVQLMQDRVLVKSITDTAYEEVVTQYSSKAMAMNYFRIYQKLFAPS